MLEQYRGLRIAIMAAGAVTTAASCVLISKDRSVYPNLYKD